MGYGIYNNASNGVYKQFNRKGTGNLVATVYFKHGQAKNYIAYFPDGKIKEEGEGVFHTIRIKHPFTFISMYPLIFISGIIKVYNENGKLIKIEKK